MGYLKLLIGTVETRVLITKTGKEVLDSFYDVSSFMITLQ